MLIKKKDNCGLGKCLIDFYLVLETAKLVSNKITLFLFSIKSGSDKLASFLTLHFGLRDHDLNPTKVIRLVP